jgi:hypothetical protein
MLSTQMKQDIETLIEVVTDDSSIAKLLQRKYNTKISVLEVRRHRLAKTAIAEQKPETPEETAIVVEEARAQLPVRVGTSVEEGSNSLLAATCRWAFKHGKLLPNLTLQQQRDRARADGYSGPIEGWA